MMYSVIEAEVNRAFSVKFRGEWQPTPVFLPGSPWTEVPGKLQSCGGKELNTIEQLSWPHYSVVDTGLEKVSFHSNPKERQCQECSNYWKVVVELKKTPGFLAPGGEEFNPGSETRLDRSELLCNQVLLKYQGDRESLWHRHQKGA